MKVYGAYYAPSRYVHDTQVFSEKFQTLMKINRYTPCILGDRETTYSSVFFHLLDRFLFPDAEKGCILRQPVLHKDRYGHSNKPDGYTAKLKSGVSSTPILVSDLRRLTLKRHFLRALDIFNRFQLYPNSMTQCSLCHLHQQN